MFSLPLYKHLFQKLNPFSHRKIQNKENPRRKRRYDVKKRPVLIWERSVTSSLQALNRQHEKTGFRNERAVWLLFNQISPAAPSLRLSGQEAFRIYVK